MPAFKNILLPVDFTSNTELSIRKAIDYVDIAGGAIHLLHITNAKEKLDEENFSEFFRLEQLKKIVHSSAQHVTVDAEIVGDYSVERGIIKKAAMLHPDLIIIAKHSNRKFFSLRKQIFPGSLAKKTGCGVLTVKPGCLENKIKSIVIPVQSIVPKRKLELLVPLALKKNITVYLVSMISKKHEYDEYDASLSHALVETYRLLKGEVNCQVFHQVVSGNNVAKAALRFAQSINADVLLANPKEINISNISRLDVPDMLMRDSKLQVLTIEPEYNNVWR